MTADQGGSGFVSPAIRAIAGRRLAEIAGLAMAMGGIFVFVALITYNPRDPSLNTATSQHPTNLGGPAGSIVADFLLQGFGCAGGLPGLAMLIWAWRIASRRGIGHFGVRVFCTVCAVPLAALSLSAIHGAGAWPTAAGLGGAGGHLLAGATTEWVQGFAGPAAPALVGVVATCLAVFFIAGSFGLSVGEWRRAGGAAVHAAHAGAQAGRRAGNWGGSQAAGLVARAAPTARSYTPAPPGAIEDDDEDYPPSTEPARGASAAPRQEASAPAKAAPLLVRARARVALPDKRAATPGARQESLPLGEAGWRFPPLSLLRSAPARAQSGPSEESLQNNARLLESVLADYGVQGAIRDIRPGPVVTLYELEPAPGIRSARVIGLADDVARSLSVTAVRIATVPGRNVIGIEVPNQKRETVFLSELIENEAFSRNAARLPLALGKDISGSPIVSDLARMPHLLIAGTTGSGKSVGINAMILSLLYKLPPGSVPADFDRSEDA